MPSATQKSGPLGALKVLLASGLGLLVKTVMPKCCEGKGAYGLKDMQMFRRKALKQKTKS